MWKNVRDRVVWARLTHDEKYIKFGFGLTTLIIVILLINIFYLNLLISKNLIASSTSHPTPQNKTEQKPIPSPVITQILTPTILPTPTSTQAFAKDYYIQLGSGMNNTNTWTSVPGAQAVVDLGNYQGISQVLFEASINMPNASQMVYIRLWDASDQHEVWYSDLSTNNPTAYLISQPLAYDTGPKLYQVQMMSQLPAPVNLVSSQIHIVLQ